MSEMIDRVAKAIAAFDDCEFIQPHHIGIASAAIAAMREPTGDMKREGLGAMVAHIKRRHLPLKAVKDGETLSEEDTTNRYMTLGSLMRNSLEIEAAYVAMIDEALK